MSRSRSVSPTQHGHRNGSPAGSPARTSFEARQARSQVSGAFPIRTSGSRSRSNSRASPTVQIQRVIPSVTRGRSPVAEPPPSIHTHSGPYAVRRVNSEHSLSHNFNNPNLPIGWSSALATIGAASRLKPVLPPSFSDPALPATEAGTVEAIQDYYKERGLEFDNLDTQDVYEMADDKLMDRDLKNMVVDFGRESSWVSMNVEDDKCQDLLKSWDESKRPKEIGTRWIAIFNAHEQGEFLNQILQKYGLSTRLRATMLSPPGRGNLEIAQKVWHWSTVEYGNQFMAVGFNMLHNTVSRRILKRAREDFHETAALQEAMRTGAEPVTEDNSSSWLKNFLKKKEGHSPANSTLLPYAHSHASGSSSNDEKSKASKQSQTLFAYLRKRMTNFSNKDAAAAAAAAQPADDDDFETFREAVRRQFTSKPKGKRSSSKSKRSSKGKNNAKDSDSLDDELSLNQDQFDEEKDDDDGLFECNEAEEDFNDLHYNPHMLRLWIWIIMTHDGNVISIHEPIPQVRKDITDPRDIKDTTSHIRRNIRVVMRCLSKAGLAKKRSGSNDVEVAMEQGALVVRRTVGQARDLLFYYLFDDWYASWSLAVDRAHPYSKELNEIRGEDPQLEHIDKLHDISRRLASLKRVYNSYEQILDRLLENKAFFRDPQNKCFSILSMNRFERLKYRISQLAISEIEDCEKEANGLISLTYNRLNFRETKAVERLSLLSVMLATTTIIFLPISIVMGYFGMEGVAGISGEYNKNNFWAAVGVAAALTFTFLWLVGGLGGAYEVFMNSKVVQMLLKPKKLKMRAIRRRAERLRGYGYHKKH